MRFEAINLIGNRADIVPSYIPESAIIFNAPRPLLGDSWEGKFRCGIFYAAVSPDDPYRQERIREVKLTVLCSVRDCRQRVGQRDWGWIELYQTKVLKDY